MQINVQTLNIKARDLIGWRVRTRLVCNLQSIYILHMHTERCGQHIPLTLASQCETFQASDVGPESTVIDKNKEKQILFKANLTKWRQNFADLRGSVRIAFACIYQLNTLRTSNFSMQWTKNLHKILHKEICVSLLHNLGRFLG